jgi:hypothetical protein
MQYIALIHKNTDTAPTRDEWDRFINVAKASGMFKGGSEIGLRQPIGPKAVPDSTQSVGGYMRFDSDDPEQLHLLLQAHPVVRHGGTIELCEMPES